MTRQVYVGKTLNMERRMDEHAPSGCRLIPLLTRGSKSDLESWERNEVLTRMYLNGTESTRGWKYTRRGKLTRDEATAARDDIMEKFDLCRRCGRNNHFANRCFAQSAATWCRALFCDFRK